MRLMYIAEDGNYGDAEHLYLLNLDGLRVNDVIDELEDVSDHDRIAAADHICMREGVQRIKTLYAYSSEVDLMLTELEAYFATDPTPSWTDPAFRIAERLRRLYIGFR